MGFSYSLWRFQLRTFWNYTGAIYNNASLTNPSWIASADTVNVNVQYKVNSRLNASINVANLFNKWPSVYQQNPQRLVTSEVYGTRITLGGNGRF